MITLVDRTVVEAREVEFRQLTSGRWSDMSCMLDILLGGVYQHTSKTEIRNLVVAVEEEDGRIIAWATAYRAWRRRMMDVYVAPESRRRGLGLQLVKTVLEENDRLGEDAPVVDDAPREFWVPVADRVVPVSVAYAHVLSRTEF